MARDASGHQIWVFRKIGFEILPAFNPDPDAGLYFLFVGKTN